MGLQDRYGPGEDELEDYEIDPARKKRRLLTMVFLVVFSIGSTVAASITINKGKITEFGQGIYQVKACDQFITIHLVGSTASYTSTGLVGSGYSNVSNIRLVGLDPVSCKGNTIRIRLFKSGSSNPMQLWSTAARTAATDTDTAYACSSPTTSCGYASLTLVVNPVPQADPAADITLLDQNGASAGYGDANGYQSILYDATYGEYTIGYLYPWASMSQVSNITVETASS